MNGTIIPREHVAERLAVSIERLVAYERRGFFQAAREGEQVGYRAEDLRRVWTVVSLHRDAGINLAGVEAILRLHEQMSLLHRELDRFAGELRAVLEEEDDTASGPR